jgi:hypothetical protein
VLICFIGDLFEGECAYVLSLNVLYDVETSMFAMHESLFLSRTSRHVVCASAVFTASDTHARYSLLCDLFYDLCVCVDLKNSCQPFCLFIHEVLSCFSQKFCQRGRL